MPARTVRVFDETKGTCVGNKVEVADTSLSRFLGLLGRRELQPGHGLLIVPSSGVHTLGMLFPIDVVFLDADSRVIKLQENLRPFRVTALNWHSESVLELPVDTIRAALVQIGDQFRIEDQASGAE